MSKILIIGASHGIGLETVKCALEAGYNVRAFARSASKIKIDDPMLEKRDGDALNTRDVENALDGIDIVVECIGLSMGPEYLSGTTFFSDATRILVETMNKSRTKRLIAVTGLGAGNSRGHGGLMYDAIVFPLVLQRIYADKDIQEQIITRSALDWTIVRPGILKDGPTSGLYQALTDAKDWHAASITRADVAQFIVDEIERPQFIHQTPLLIS